MHDLAPVLLRVVAGCISLALLLLLVTWIGVRGPEAAGLQLLSRAPTRLHPLWLESDALAHGSVVSAQDLNA